jgi:anti-anti-sigma factor
VVPDCLLPFALNVSEEGHAVRIQVTGEFDVAAAATFEKALWSSDGDPTKVEIDLREVTFIDSAALSSLVVAATTAERNGFELRIIRPIDEQVRRILKLTDIESLVPMEDDVADPIANLRRMPARDSTS